MLGSDFGRRPVTSGDRHHMILVNLTRMQVRLGLTPGLHELGFKWSLAGGWAN